MKTANNSSSVGNDLDFTGVTFVFAKIIRQIPFYTPYITNPYVWGEASQNTQSLVGLVLQKLLRVKLNLFNPVNSSAIEAHLDLHMLRNLDIPVQTESP